MSEKPYQLVVVMPVYNEAEAIAPVLRKWCAMLDTLALRYRIRAYNDGSKDATGQILQREAEVSNGRVLALNKPNSGHGPTILQGYREAAEEADWVFQIDSDDEMAPDCFPTLWDKREEFDFLVGRRAGRHQLLARKVISWVSRGCVRLFYGRGIWDVNTPYRLMRSEVFAPLYAAIPGNTFAPNVILSGLAARLKFRVFEMPVPQHDRITGEVSIKKWRLFKAAVRSFAQTIAFAFREMPRIWLWGTMVVAILARVGLSQVGHNFDFESYEIVSDIVRQGKTVYAETGRYNYGPLWFYVLAGLKALSGEGFRVALALFLAVTDCAIAGMLWYKRRCLAAVCFLLAPIGMWISGFHGQFDNVAVALALASVLCFEGKSGQPRSWLATVGLCVGLGVSITMKHVCIFFPLWLAFRERTWGRRLVVLVVPIALFLASFSPFVVREMVNNLNDETIAQVQGVARRYPDYLRQPGSLTNDEDYQALKVKVPATLGVVKNVFAYQSGRYPILWKDILPAMGLRVFPAFFLFIVALIWLGWMTRQLPLLEALAIYCGGMVCFSSSCAIQYFAIPILFTVCFPNWWSLAYNLVGFPLCIVARYGLGMGSRRSACLADLAILFLFLSLLQVMSNYHSASRRRSSDGQPISAP